MTSIPLPWWIHMDGVAPVTRWPLCLQCRRQLRVLQIRFCDVLREASFYAEVQW